MEIRATASDFGNFLVVNTGKVWYLIGARGHKATPELIQRSWNDFPSYRSAIESYANRALSNGPLPDGSWIVADCKGYFEMFLNGGWYDKPLYSFRYRDANTYYVHDLAIKSGLAHGDMSTLPKDCPYPIAVGYPGHVGYYHNGIVYQAAGHIIGTIPVSLQDTRYNRQWQFWYQIPWLDYGNYKFKEVKRMLRLTEPFMRGDDVKAFQEAANKLINAGLTVDGIFGKKSEQAAKDLQAKFGLTVDGIVGPVTWGAIERALLPNNDSAEDIAKLQKQIDALNKEKTELAKQAEAQKAQLNTATSDLKKIAEGLRTALKY